MLFDHLGLRAAVDPVDPFDTTKRHPLHLLYTSYPSAEWL